MEKLLIPTISEVPSKSEIANAIKLYYEDETKSLIEKYVTMKALEGVIKSGIATPDKKEIIKSFLEYSQGAIKYNVNGAEVQIINESLTKKLNKYAYSDNLETMRQKNEMEIDKLKNKIKALQEKIKQAEVIEVNHGIAREITDMLTGENSEPDYTIKITLPK